MYKNHNSPLHNLELLPVVILKFYPEHNINTFEDINMQPFWNKLLFGENPLFLPILMSSIKLQLFPYPSA